MYKFGLKLWSTNDFYVREAVKLFEDHIYDYIELFIVPGSFDKYNEVWKKLNIPFIIHAPHSKAEMNLAKSECKVRNRELIFETQKFADAVNAKEIIVHAGTAGDIKETVRQIKLIGDERLLIENKPYYALNDGLICNGTTPKEIEFVIKETGIGFCLDIGHAIYSANGCGKFFWEYLKEFSLLKPNMYHLTDGDSNSVYDMHEHIGEGNFSFKTIFNLLPKEAKITVESVKNSLNDLDDFAEDVAALRVYEND